MAHRVGALALIASISACGRPSVPPPPTSHGAAGQHRVERGETLWEISQQYGASVDAIARANGLRNHEIRPGQRLIIPAARRVHLVRPGETVWRIAERYRSTVDAIARANGLRNPSRISTGQRLLVPVGIRKDATPRRKTRIWTRSDPRGKGAGSKDFDWPVRGAVTSGYGLRKGAHHDGIDISAQRGTPVVAAASGRVIHADASLAGYGNLIILKHAGKFSSVYAHNRRLRVKLGEFVQKGQVIAEVGKTGRASAPHLHFEIRYDGRARNPLRYLP